MSKKTCQAPMERDPLSHEEDLAKVIDLQEVIDKQEQSQMEERLAALFAHVTEGGPGHGQEGPPQVRGREQETAAGCSRSESGDVCGARSLGEMGACCVDSAEAACLAIFSSFLRFRSLKGCVTVIPAVRQVKWHLLTLRSSGPSCVTMWNHDVSGGRVCGCHDL
ncbi:uncharacterized protein [Bos indicus]|uniref:Uncharacterized protein n=1 Tax=Bos indicus TaxID=9915 RepID=A0ABM4RIJ5_BOSIN